MITYDEYAKNIPQKLFIVIAEILIIYLSYLILFGDVGQKLFQWLHLPVEGNALRRKIVFVFNILLFFSYLATILVFVKRKVNWKEAFSLPVAFGTYYIGFALLSYHKAQPVNWIDYLGILLFLFGASTHFIAELQRHKFKQNPDNKGKLFTGGLWRFSRHYNYFADLMWVMGYVLVSRNWWSLIILILLFVFFYFFNIPLLEKYLSDKYGEQFEEYKRQTKSLIPFVL